MAVLTSNGRKTDWKRPMYISLAESRATRFRRWSDAHQPSENDNEIDVARLDSLAGADSGIENTVTAPPEGPRAPWLVPGVGNTF
jgi:hypothetical protein